MCPLRLVLIFLSAALAGFFVLRNLKNKPDSDRDRQEEIPQEQLPLATKFRSVVRGGFWACVDMASGRYLLRTLRTPSAAEEEEEKKKS